jgi:hypothetical protein
MRVLAGSEYLRHEGNNFVSTFHGIHPHHKIWQQHPITGSPHTFFDQRNNAFHALQYRELAFVNGYGP